MSRKRSSPEVDDSSQEEESLAPSPAQRPRREQQEEESPSSSSIASPIRTINAQGKPAEAGVIKRVYVENFMCHRKLTVDLCRNVNFIHGQNGSGKSAVLAAIQICLGAGARRTHRARNLKELVRKEAGEHVSGAKVRVTLLNGGDDGFQPDVYGDTITVERSISLRQGGVNGYRLLDSQGKVQSSSKKDLDMMLDQLNIQVENPVAVLDQEEAKKFLTGKATDKYSFFAKATELERMDRSYANVVDKLKTLEEQRSKTRSNFDGKVENVKRLKHEWEQYQALERLEQKVLDQKVEYAWAFYNTVQDEVNDGEEKLSVYLEKKEKRMQELTQAESLTNGPDQEQAIKEDRLKELTDESEQAAATKRQLEGDLKRAQAPVKNKERDIKHIQREETAAARNLSNAKRALQEERQRILEAEGQSDQAKRAATLKAAEDEHDELVDKEQHLRQSVTLNQRKYEEMEPSVESAKSQVEAVDRQLGGINGKLRQLEKGGSDKLAVFGRSCSAVDRLVKQARQEGRWTGPVAGPIGAHIRIASGKEEYAKVAECALGNKALDRFVVTNSRDRQLFQRIREQANCNSNECGIYQVANAKRYEVPPPPTADVETVASCLNIDNDLIFNAMVDHLRIEARAVCKSKELSERSLLVKDSNNRLTIRGGTIREVFFLPQGDRWTVSNGNLSLNSNSNKLKQTLGIDKSAAIAELKAEAQQLNEERTEFQQRLTQVNTERKDAQKKWNKDRQAHRKTLARLEDLAEKINQLRADAEESANVEIDTSELEQDVASAEQVLDALKEQYTERQRELEELIPAVREAKSRLTEVTARNEKVLADLETAAQDLQDHVQNKTQREEKYKKSKAKMESMNEIIVQLEAGVAKLQKDRDVALHKARELHYRRDAERKRLEEQEDAGEDLTPPTTQEMTAQATEEELAAIEPIPTRKEPAYYQSKIERTRKKIEDEKKRRRMTESDPQVAFEKYMRAHKDLETDMKMLDKIEENVGLLAADVKARKKKWYQFRRHITVMTNETFNDILNTKGSSGELDFDHEDETLDLVVQKDSTQENTQTADVKALSGGERSFTTLALLLALGERLETPFRVMDEFDVFLDPVARKIALDTLVSMAKSMEHRQFIFITPQDVSSLKTDPLLKIFHMKPPARDSRVGGPTQQTLDFSQASGE